MAVITCDSTIDLTPELVKKYDLRMIPLFVTLDEETYKDGVDIKTNDIFEFVQRTGNLPKTATRGIDEYADFFKENQKNGEEIVHIGIGSTFSGSYSCVNIAIDEHKLKNIYVVDTKSLSTGSGLLAIYAAELAKQGKSAKEIYEKCTARVPYIQASFVIENLKFLYKGGRCSMLSVLGANLLRIKPAIQVINGENKVHRKYMGNIVGAIKKYCEDTLAEYNQPDLTRCMITYSTATPEMLQVAKEALEKFGKFKEVIVTEAGGVICSHCGKNTLGILYINDADKNPDIYK